jgi:hypothetical protein
LLNIVGYSASARREDGNEKMLVFPRTTRHFKVEGPLQLTPGEETYYFVFTRNTQLRQIQFANKGYVEVFVNPPHEFRVVMVSVSTHEVKNSSKTYR